MRHAVVAIAASCISESAVIDRMVVVSGRLATASRGGCELAERKASLRALRETNPRLFLSNSIWESSS